jgi:vacuolar-type H+-ATPase subunit F/Vma7
MSRLMIITRPSLAAGFQMAGVEAYPAEDAESAQEVLEGQLAGEEINLIAIDDGLLAMMDPNFVRRMQASGRVLYMAIPGGRPLGREASRRHRIAEMIRKAIGFQITFKDETNHETE